MAEGSGSRGGAPSRSSTRAAEAGGAAFLHTARRSSLSRLDTSPADSFFSNEPPPPNVATAGLRVRQFVRPLLEKEELKESKVAIITAGGTDVPLEREAVRYITNTSSGERGAALCEQLLRLGYHVVYVTSVRAMKPFVRHVLPIHPMPHILDSMALSSLQKQQEEEGQRQQPEPIVEEPSSETDASEGEKASMSPPPSERVAYETYTTVYEEDKDGDGARVVTSVGSVVNTSDPQADDQDAGVTTEPAEASSSAAAAEAAAGAAAAAVEADDSGDDQFPWSVILRGPLDSVGVDTGMEDEAVDASGWTFGRREAAAAFELYSRCKTRLLCITYRTLVDYAFIVRAVTAGAAPLRERLMFCSAAAVADFYLPHALMSAHKLKSSQPLQPAHLPSAAAVAASEGAEKASRDLTKGSSHGGSFIAAMQPKRWFTGESEASDTVAATEAAGEEVQHHHRQQQQHNHHHLTLRLWMAPKILSVVRSIAPLCFVVAFKLETDPEQLQQSVTAYLGAGDSSCNSQGVADCVVGNVLSTRRQAAFLFTKDIQKQIKFKAKQAYKYLGHGTIEARLAKHIQKLQDLKVKEGFL
ncbi:DNA/pantothenate metabolism flavoprotein domain-containing protein, putative [Eimeria maxima]|uniref:DNA/pantothenate metabolism flavoprotein domain-containing protein, putative n=1 Tax=Eimeria maxima TaxID=5804 RepID=U6MDL4_EIMMA|nr:DNA/pantothenate metabolism flavoprotein domain-containing protein, putative [Eimeria maxima]CDJ61148.1 DNA/pantothenate metabolism flavoprotein domain-containing protein, putative [Eimeria maxima]